MIGSVKKIQRDIRTSRSYSSTPHYYKSKKPSNTPLQQQLINSMQFKKHEEVPFRKLEKTYKWQIHTQYSIVQHGFKVNFNQQPISNSNFEHPRNRAEIEILDKEIKKLLKKGVIKEANTGIE